MFFLIPYKQSIAQGYGFVLVVAYSYTNLDFVGKANYFLATKNVLRGNFYGCPTIFVET